VALSALNIPSAADIERLTRRLRSVSHRLEGIEDGVDRLDRGTSTGGVEARLSAIEQQLRTLTSKLDQPAKPKAAAKAQPKAKAAKPKATAKAAGVRGKSGTPAAKPKAAAKPAKAKAARAKPKAG